MPAVPDYLINPQQGGGLFIPPPGQSPGLFEPPSNVTGDVLQGLSLANGAYKLGSGAYNLFSGAGSLGGALGGIGSSLAGAGLSHLFGQKAHNAGGQIGGAIGGIAGSFVPVPVLGTFAGAELGKAIGGMFGPRKTVGPGGTWGYDFRSGQPVGMSGDNGWNGSELGGYGGGAVAGLFDYANANGGRIGADSLQFGWQPQQGQPQVAFNVAGRPQHVEQLYDDADFLRGALRSGAIDMTGSGKTWQEAVNAMGPSYLERLWAQQNQGPLEPLPGQQNWA